MSEKPEFSYTNTELQALIVDLMTRYHATHLHPHRCELFKKVLELIDIQIMRARSFPVRD